MYNLLIAEDEPMIRKGICGALDWEAIGFAICGAVESGVEALERIAQGGVDVLLTDIKMPGMDGLEAIREVRRTAPETEIVVLSGYADFAYACEALKYQVFDYVLKMDILTSLGPVMRRLREKMDRARAAQPADALQAILEQLEAQMPAGAFGSRRLLFVESPAAGGGQLLAGQCVAAMEPGGFAVAIRRESVEGMENAVAAFLRKARAMGARGIVGAALLRADDALRSLTELAKARDFLQTRSGEWTGMARVEELRYAVGELGVTVQAKAWARLLADAPVDEQREGLARLIRHFIETEGATIVHARLCVMLALSLAACTDPGGVGMLYTDALPQLSRAVSMRTLERTAAQLLDDAASRAPAERAEPSVIARAVRYINANFCKNLRQEAVASRFYISTPYFSRLFKQEVGMGFTEYIRKLRMEWAKSLLEETDMRIHDIARDCGYADIKHFNQTFRAYHGMSASELRKRDSRKNHPIDE